jgi:hypothetical protein
MLPVMALAFTAVMAEALTAVMLAIQRAMVAPLETQVIAAQTESRRLLESVLHEALAPTALQTL